VSQGPKPSRRIRVFRLASPFRVRPFTVAVDGFALVNEHDEPRTFKTRTSAVKAGVKILADQTASKVRIKRNVGQGRPAQIYRS
jgi:hypothetical protein